jgi:hypothetical protein
MRESRTRQTGVPLMTERFPRGRPGATGEATAGGPGNGVRRHLAIAALAALAVLVAAGVAVPWARSDGQHASNSRGSSPSAPATTSEAPSAAGTPSTTAATLASAPSPAEPVLEAGRHAVFLTGLDVANRTVEFDLIQFLTGDEALAAFQRDHGGDLEGWANDYYIVNDNPRLRTLPVADDVELTVVRTSESVYDTHSIPFEELPAYVAAGPIQSDQRLGQHPFWLTVRGDTVVAIDEQFLP